MFLVSTYNSWFVSPYVVLDIQIGGEYSYIIKECSYLLNLQASGDRILMLSRTFKLLERIFVVKDLQIIGEDLYVVKDLQIKRILMS